MKATPDENEDDEEGTAEAEAEPHPLESGIEDAKEGNTASLDEMLSKLE